MSIYADSAPFDIFGPEHTDTLPDLPAPMWEHDPDHNPRTGLALKLARQALGMAQQDMADYCGVALRTEQRWETLPQIPGWVETAIRQLSFHTDMWAADLEDSEGVMVKLYPRGWRIVNGRPVPESWWRMLVGQGLIRTPLMPVEMQE